MEPSVGKWLCRIADSYTMDTVNIISNNTTPFLLEVQKSPEVNVALLLLRVPSLFLSRRNDLGK